MHLHLAGGFDGDAGESAAPTGMDGGDGALLGVDEKDGDAVGGLNREGQAGVVGERGVTATRLGGCELEEMDDVGVELFEGDESEAASAKAGLEAAAVFEDVVAGVPVGETEVEDALALKFRDAAGKRGETVDEPGEFGEGGNLEDLQGVGGERLPMRGRRGMNDARTLGGAAAACFRHGHRETSIISGT